MRYQNRASRFMAVLVASVLAACGGGGSSAGSTVVPPVITTPGTATIGGTVTGLPAATTLLLVNNAGDTISTGANGNFTFDTSIQVGSAYNVTLFTQPLGASCTVANGTGTIDQNADKVSNIAVSCQAALITFINFNVGVTVSGLNAGNTVSFLNNGTDTVTAHANGLSVFPATYSLEGAPVGQTPGAYQVTVATQPAGQTCTLSNASGLETNANFSNFVSVTATCK